MKGSEEAVMPVPNSVTTPAGVIFATRGVPTPTPTQTPAPTVTPVGSTPTAVASTPTRVPTGVPPPAGVAVPALSPRTLAFLALALGAAAITLLRRAG